MAGSFDEGLEFARRLIAVSPQNQQAHILLAVDAFKQKQFDVALEHADEMGAGPLSSVLAPNMKIWIALAQNDENMGARAVKKIDPCQLVCRRAFGASGAGFEVNGNHEAAAAHYSEAVRAGAARYLYFVLSYGAFLERQDEPDKAAKLYAFYHSTHFITPMFWPRKSA